MMAETIRAYKALGEPIRLRILALLAREELCVCALVEVLSLPQSTVSRHLALLKAAGWVCDRRQGVWMYYRLAGAGDFLPATVQQEIIAHLAGLPEASRDQKRLARFLQQQGGRACA